MKKFIYKYLIVLVIILFSFIIRIYVIGTDLPNLYWPDEVDYVETALRFGSGNLSPYSLSHGSLLQFILLLEFGIYFLIKLAFGLIHNASDLIFEYISNPTIFYLMGRMTIALLGTGCVFLSYLIGRKLYNPRVGILSSLFIGFSLVLFQMSTIISSDILSAFLLLCAFLSSMKIFSNSSLDQNRVVHYYLLSGIFIGLATAAKYYAIFGLSFLFFSHLFSFRENGKKISFFRLLDKNLLLATFMAIFVFLISVPWIFLNWKKFYQDTFIHLFSEYILQNPNKNVWLFHFTHHLKNSIGLPLEILMLLGLLIILLRHPRKDILLITFPAFYFILLSQSTGFAYHWTPALAFLLILAARTLDWIFTSFFKFKKADSVVFLLGLILLTPTLFDCFRYVHLLRSPDTRNFAKEWVEENISENSSILIEGCIGTLPIQVPQLKSNKETLKGDFDKIRRLGATGSSITAEIKYAKIDKQNVRYRLFKVDKIFKETLEKYQADYIITSGYFDMDMAELNYYLERDYLNKRKKMYLALKEEYVLIEDFKPSLYFRLYFPLFFNPDFKLLKKIKLFGRDANDLIRGPEIKIFRRRDLL